MASKSFTSCRLRPIRAKNRSTTQRRGLTAKPTWSGSLRTISTAFNVALATFRAARPTMKFVATKTADQLDLQTLRTLVTHYGPLRPFPVMSSYAR